MTNYIWYLKLPDNSEHKFYSCGEADNPLENVSGFKQGAYYLVQAPSLSGASGVNPYAFPSGNPADGCYAVLQTDVVDCSGIQNIP